MSSAPVRMAVKRALISNDCLSVVRHGLLAIRMAPRTSTTRASTVHTHSVIVTRPFLESVNSCSLVASPKPWNNPNTKTAGRVFGW
jgi:hypothetical protein